MKSEVSDTASRALNIKRVSGFYFFKYMTMLEKTIERNGQKVVEVRSDGGKLLYVKTKEGYEMKCPRTKKICVVGYDKMLFDCLKCMSGIPDDELLFEKAKQIWKLFEDSVKA